MIYIERLSPHWLRDRYIVNTGFDLFLSYKQQQQRNIILWPNLYLINDVMACNAALTFIKHLLLKDIE